MYTYINEYIYIYISITVFSEQMKLVLKGIYYYYNQAHILATKIRIASNQEYY